MVYAPRYGSRLATIVLKYHAQWKETASILRSERPDVVFVMTPPLVAALAGWQYIRRHGGRLVLDAHSAAFLHPRWRHLQWLQRWLCRQAATTLAHNEHIAGLVRAAGGHATLVPDVPIVYDEIERYPRSDRFTVAVVCSFNADEPIPAILEAARLTPEVDYRVTGDPRQLAKHLAASLPPNVTLTGFLSVPAYGGLLTGADAVLALTTRNHTMLRGAYEAVYQATPVIVSNWPMLREAFDEGAVHVDNTGAGIAEAVRVLRSRLDDYRAGVRRLRERKLHAWHVTRQAILGRIASGALAPGSLESQA